MHPSKKPHIATQCWCNAANEPSFQHLCRSVQWNEMAGPAWCFLALFCFLFIWSFRSTCGYVEWIWIDYAPLAGQRKDRVKGLQTCSCWNRSWAGSIRIPGKFGKGTPKLCVGCILRAIRASLFFQCNYSFQSLQRVRFFVAFSLVKQASMALRTIVHLFWIWLVVLKSSQRTGSAVRLCFFDLDIFPTHWLALQLKYSDISRFAAGTISAFSSILQHPSIGTCWSHNGTSSDRLSNKIKVHDPSDDKSEGDWERRCHLRTNSFRLLWCKRKTIELSKSLFLPLWVAQYSDWPMHRSSQTHCNRQAHASTSEKHHLQISYRYLQDWDFRAQIT